MCLQWHLLAGGTALLAGNGDSNCVQVSSSGQLAAWGCLDCGSKQLQPVTSQTVRVANVGRSAFEVNLTQTASGAIARYEATLPRPSQQEISVGLTVRISAVSPPNKFVYTINLGYTNNSTQAAFIGLVSLANAGNSTHTEQVACVVTNAQGRVYALATLITFANSTDLKTVSLACTFDSKQVLTAYADGKAAGNYTSPITWYNGTDVAPPVLSLRAVITGGAKQVSCLCILCTRHS